MTDDSNDGPLTGQSIYKIDGMYLYEPDWLWSRHAPPCACDESVKASGWTFMDARLLDVGTVEVFCRKCGAVGDQWPLVDPERC